MREFIKNMPKVELHMHIEGSMDAKQLWQLAHKNNYELKYKNIEELKQAYKFNNLTEFIDMYMLGTKVIQSEQDLYDVCMNYFKQCVQQNIRHTEVHCDIRTYIDYGYPAEFVINALHGAFMDAKSNYGISGGFMPCFIRHLGNKVAQEDLELMLPFKDKILAIGLSAVELGFPPSLFKDTFKKVHDAGINVIAHAGEEAPAEYIWSAIKDIHVDRIDHGIRCLEDDNLVAYLGATQIPLTVCPYSNVALKIYANISQHVLPLMLDAGLNVSIHSDDPAHFNANLTKNIVGIVENTSITQTQVIQMAHNAINGSFADKDRKNELTIELNQYVNSH
ncbi:Adenosine deaminase [hydrothermal vent metagenome]|uniref:Adenosine deaminase n=1 Tax=hydrothermal vent metagenome TaxID=652676 RepID=A0A3B0VTJ5_9ZZZZ